MRRSPCTSRCSIPTSVRRAARSSTATRARTSARQASTRWSTTGRAVADCRSTRPTACTARPAISRTRTRSSTGRRPKADPGRIIRTCDGPSGMSEPIWTPSTQRITASNLTRFAQLVRREYGAPPGDYAALWRWSVDERERFWQALMQFAGTVRGDGTAPVLRDRDRMPGAVWFEDTQLNYAENLLAGASGLAEALVSVNERGERRAMSGEELAREVARVAAGLRDDGIGPGDRVAGFLPNLSESVIAMLAATSLGAVWT